MKPRILELSSQVPKIFLNPHGQSELKSTVTSFFDDIFFETFKTFQQQRNMRAARQAIVFAQPKASNDNPVTSVIDHIY